ncbi:hypothetical protein EYE40_08175 [Glaciihabitans arcticus]|uniref:Uncharacterized protein n=1 Tax=Glaciihabitans arcticus TaxID=2668039 RepID=A0A4Q9GR28_9MICO|nr:hypothetical protein EYE40_08175 [Glaciihabitans arcticus]
MNEPCLSWVDLSDPADAAEAADLVIIGEEIGPDGTESYFGTPGIATVHRVHVDQVLKGTLDDQEIRVLSVPESACGTGPVDRYPNGDPLDVSGPAEYFLTDDEGQWRTQTPSAGVMMIPADGVLPWDPTGPTPSPAP